ncbi:MAG: sulfotransferase [Desulfobacteraceae bacterium]
MQKDDSILIHPGFPKCASTFLQKKIFSVHPEIDYIGPELFTNRGFNGLFMNIPTADYDPVRVRALFSSAAAARVLSVETLVGDPYFNPMAGELYAKRLKETFPNAKILLIIRSQADVLESLILQWVKTGWTGKMGINDFFKPKRFYTETYTFDLSYFKYSGIIALYRHYFGKDNVKILGFEKFTENIPAGVKQIFEFMNLEVPDIINTVPVKRRMTLAGYLFMRYVNRYRTGKFNLKGGVLDIVPWVCIMRVRNALDKLSRSTGVSKSYTWMTDTFRRDLEAYYREDNDVTRHLIGEDTLCF